MQTVMLRNIPCRYSEQMMVDEFHEAGFEGTYDYFHMPFDCKRKGNRGYAFLNFISTDFVKPFRQKFDGCKLKSNASEKVLAISPATFQGFEANFEHFQRISQENAPACHPVFLRGGNMKSAEVKVKNPCQEDNCLQSHVQDGCSKTCRYSYEGPLPPRLHGDFESKTSRLAPQDTYLKPPISRQGFSEAFSSPSCQDTSQQHGFYQDCSKHTGRGVIPHPVANSCQHHRSLKPQESVQSAFHFGSPFALQQPTQDCCQEPAQEPPPEQELQQPQSQQQFCSHCGALRPPSFVFCGNCGEPLDGQHSNSMKDVQRRWMAQRPLQVFLVVTPYQVLMPPVVYPASSDVSYCPGFRNGQAVA